MKVFYHNDMDGTCAAYWVRLSAAIHPMDRNYCFKTIEMSYGKPFPWDQIEKNEQVWIVDYSIEPSEMQNLLERTKEVTWIDHHKTAIEKYKNFPHELRGVRREDEAACILTFKYIHWWTGRGDGPINLSRELFDNPVPEFTALIGDRDIWAFRYGERTKYFYLGCQLYDWSDLDSSFWDLCFLREDGVDRIIKEGKISERFRDNFAAKYLRSYSFEVQFEGYWCLAMNMGLCSSEYFLGLDKKYDILMPFVFNGKQWNITLFSKSIDVSHIAKKYGGGGHKGASGFACQQLPWNN